MDQCTVYAWYLSTTLRSQQFYSATRLLDLSRLSLCASSRPSPSQRGDVAGRQAQAALNGRAEAVRGRQRVL